MWGEKERIFAEVAAKEQRQDDILHADPPRNDRPIHAGFASNLGLSPEELNKKIEEDPPRFRAIYNLACDKGIGWEEAEKIHNNRIAQQENLLDKVSRSYQTLYPNEPKPHKLFQEFHKRRKKTTKAELARRATAYKKWKEASDAINTE